MKTLECKHFKALDGVVRPYKLYGHVPLIRRISVSWWHTLPNISQGNAPGLTDEDKYLLNSAVLLGFNDISH